MPKAPSIAFKIKPQIAKDKTPRLPEKKPRVPALVPPNQRVKPTLPIEILNRQIEVPRKPRLPSFPYDKTQTTQKSAGISVESKSSKESLNYIT